MVNWLETYPGTLSQAVEAKLVCDLGGVHGVLDEWSANVLVLVATLESRRLLQG